MIREALDRAKAQTLEVCILNLRRLELLESRAAATLLGRLTPHPKEKWARVSQLREARAGRRGVDGWLWQFRREQAAATLLGRLTPHPKEKWARVSQLREARAGRRGVDGWLWQFRREQAAEDSSSEGCSDFLALAERCSWSELSRRSVCRVKVAALA